jgi:hypothetical protein
MPGFVAETGLDDRKPPVAPSIKSCPPTMSSKGARHLLQNSYRRHGLSRKVVAVAGWVGLRHRMELAGTEVVTTAAVVHEFEDFSRLSAKLATRMPEHMAAGMRGGLR